MSELDLDKNSVIAIQQYLMEFGYLEPRQESTGILDEPTRAGLERFARRAGISLVPSAKPTILAAIDRPRCAVKDPQTDDLYPLPEPALGCETCGWQERETLYWVDVGRLPRNCAEDYHGYLPLEVGDVLAAVDAAADAWTRAIAGLERLVLRRTEDEGRADIEVFWSKLGADAYGDALAQAEPPSCCAGAAWSERLPIKFRLDLPEEGEQAEWWWYARKTFPDGTPQNLVWWDIETVALHEFGHALGLSHTQNGEVMFWSPRPGLSAPELSTADIAYVLRVIEAYPQLA